MLDADDDAGEPVVLVGPLIHLEERERAHIVGTWVDDRRYGLQIKVPEARPLPPTDIEAVVAYLRRVKHVGAKRAAALDAATGWVTCSTRSTRPEGAFAAVGLRRRAPRRRPARGTDLRVMRRLHLLLAPHGLGYLAARIQRHYGPTAHRVVAERPYELTGVFGVGFLIADRIARAAGASTAGAERIRAGVLHTLAEAERGGTTCLPLTLLQPALEELLGVPVGRRDRPARRRRRSGPRGGVDLPGQTAALEAELAERVQAMLDHPDGDRLPEAPVVEELTAEQRAGVRGAFAHRLSLITGGPGTGKTASIKTIADWPRRSGRGVLLVAPTGRAAMRMTEASGAARPTVHSALGWIPGEGPTHDEQDPLAATC